MSRVPFESGVETIIAGVLESCGLLASLSREQRAALVEGCRLLHAAPGELLCQEGTPGEELFILESGSLEVFSSLNEAEVVYHRLSTRGEHVGEQALQAGSRLRSASIRAATAAVVVALHQEQYLEATAADPNIARVVTSQGDYQERERMLSAQSVMYRAMAVFDEEGFSEEAHIRQGDIVFQQGDQADMVYFILRGTARVLQHDEHGKVNLDIALHEGQMFGEQGVMKNTPRTATIMAQTPLDLICFRRDRFLSAVSESPELYQYMLALRRMYNIRSSSSVQFDGQLRDQNAIVNVVQVDSTHQVTARLLIETHRYSATREGPDGVLSGERYEYADPRRKTWRTVSVSNGQLQQVEAQGPWDELGRVQKLLESGEPISAEQLQHFTQYGTLLRAHSLEPDPILCHCLNLRRSQIEQAIAGGCETVVSLGEVLGAGRVCGGCTGTLAEVVGSGGEPMRMVSSLDVGLKVKSLRFVPVAASTLSPSWLGQHVVVSAEIDGKRVARAYTLTSPDTQTEYREITVKREPYGLFSSWLCDAPIGTVVEVSPPQGHFFVEPDGTHDVVCFVAGIGMTPALAMARSFASHARGRRLRIDYTTGYPRDRVAIDELAELAQLPSIELTHRYSSRGERLTASAVTALAAQYPGAHYYTCGPHAFQAMIEHALTKAGVTPERVHVESFTPGQAAPEGSPRSWVDWAGSAAAIAATLAYVLQDLLELSPAALVRLQQEQTYQLASGLLLVIFLAFQWWLPARRLQGRSAEAARLTSTHRWLGWLAPVFFALHSLELGYGMMALLSTAYLANVVVGALDKTILHEQGLRQRYARAWLPVHIVLSMITVVVGGLHIYIAMAYKGAGG